MQVRDAGNLLTRANLAIPSVDTDEIIVNYRNMDELVRHLRWDVLLEHEAVHPVVLGPRQDVAACSCLDLSEKVQSSDMGVEL